MKSSGTFTSDLKAAILKSAEGFEGLIKETAMTDPDYYEALLDLRRAAINAIAVSIDPRKAKKVKYNKVVESAVERYQKVILAAL